MVKYQINIINILKELLCFTVCIYILFIDWYQMKYTIRNEICLLRLVDEENTKILFTYLFKQCLYYSNVVFISY